MERASGGWCWRPAGKRVGTPSEAVLHIQCWGPVRPEESPGGVSGEEQTEVRRTLRMDFHQAGGRGCKYC